MLSRARSTKYLLQFLPCANHFIPYWFVYFASLSLFFFFIFESVCYQEQYCIPSRTFPFFVVARPDCCDSMNRTQGWRSLSNGIPRPDRGKPSVRKFPSSSTAEMPPSAFLTWMPFLSSKNSLWAETWQIKSWEGKVIWK